METDRRIRSIDVARGVAMVLMASKFLLFDMHSGLMVVASVLDANPSASYGIVPQFLGDVSES